MLVNCAGIYPMGDILGTSLEAWNEFISVNLTGSFICSKFGVQQMIEKGGGAVVNIDSRLGLDAVPQNAAYSVSKAGLISLTKSIAVDFIDRNVSANCICPATVETPGLAKWYPGFDINATCARIPTKRLVQPEEIAHLALFLVSDESTSINGTVIPVDGGLHAM